MRYKYLYENIDLCKVLYNRVYIYDVEVFFFILENFLYFLLFNIYMSARMRLRSFQGIYFPNLYYMYGLVHAYQTLSFRIPGANHS